MKQLEVILKTVERCNINCSYCYMFNMGDKTYNNRPVFMSDDIILKTVSFLKEGCIKLNIKSLIISFHGGEPLMQKKDKFEFFCKLLYKELSGVVNVSLQLHTNAMLIDQEWLDLFYHYSVGVGVSIDGVKKYHDIDRKDKRNRGTYDRVIKGIKQLSEDSAILSMGNYGLLCVINPDHNAKENYRHFVDDLNAKCLDFLLPHCTYDNPPPSEPKLYGQYLLEIFNEWIQDDNPNINVRIIKSILETIRGGYSHMYGVGPRNKHEIPIICINTDGGVTPTDEFRAMTNDLVYTNSYVNNICLQEYLNLPLFQKLDIAADNLAKECLECEWMAICRGGSLVNRFSEKNGFDNPSVYCDGLKVLYKGISDYLNKNLPEYLI